MHGYDVRCLQAATLLTRGYADSHQLARVTEMADKDIRQIAFTGTRRTSSTRDASYRVVDATGLWTMVRSTTGTASEARSVAEPRARG